MAQTVKPLLRTAAGKNSLFDVSLIARSFQAYAFCRPDTALCRHPALIHYAVRRTNSFTLKPSTASAAK